MKDTFILNLVHRPEMMPEYAETVTNHGKKAHISDAKVINESLEIFKLQQEIAHKNGLKTTIQMTYGSLFSDEAVSLAKAHHEQYGDEISLTLLGLPCSQFRDKYQTKDFCIWMFSYQDKMAIVEDVFELFFEKFGFYPQSTGSYYLDAPLINYIKKRYPSVKCAIATCWEEGPKAYHTCNNSWYTFMDGGPWNPWIPSKSNTHAPAKDKREDSGIVAIPHLSRDLIACFDGNGSNFGTHPQNVLRGMIYRDGEYPYLYNLIDQYRHLAKYNNGYAYNMMFVGPGWMNKAGRWEAPYSLLLKSYEDGLAYYGKLKKENKLVDLTMSEFADYYRANKTYKEAEVALWQDILYGSNKQLFWYVDPYFRFCLDMNQGGAMIDLRPYVSKLKRPVGIDTNNVYDASYPYLIQANYRAGYFTHYAGEGTIKSAKVIYHGEEVDLALCRSKAQYYQNGATRQIILDPVTIEFSDLSATIQTTFTIKEGQGAILTERKVLSLSDPSKEIEIHEYMTASYGTTEYSLDMRPITLSINDGKTQSIKYRYRNREIVKDKVRYVAAHVAPLKVNVMMSAHNPIKGYIREGYAFSPMFTIGLKQKLQEKETIKTWLKLKKVA